MYRKKNQYEAYENMLQCQIQVFRFYDMNRYHSFKEYLQWGILESFSLYPPKSEKIRFYESRTKR